MDLPKLKFKELAQATNLTDKFSETELSALGSRVHQDYMNDEQTRSGWLKRNKESMKLALQVTEEKNTPWPNASNVKFPLLSQAALQFQVRAYGNLAKGPEIVKHRVMGNDPRGLKAARAARVSTHMNFQLLDNDEWEDAFDRLLMVLPIMGLCYTKKYWCPAEQRLKTTLVLPQDLVVPYRTKSLASCQRITEKIELYDREIKGLQLEGIYQDIKLGTAQPLEEEESDKRDGITSGTDTEIPRRLLEQHLYLDLDGDGYSEPYTVTIDESSRKVLRVVQRFGEFRSEQKKGILELNNQIAQLRRQIQDILAQLPPPNGEEMTDDQIAMAQQAQAQGEEVQDQIGQLELQIEELEAQDPDILGIDPIRLYTKYGFIPAPDGSFYEVGFGSLIGPLNRSVNSLLNQLIDSGSLQNGSQGFLGKGARLKGGKINFQPYEWKKVSVHGNTLRDSIVPLPINQPSAVLFNLLGLLIEYTKDLSSVNDAMAGKDMGQNTPAYNMEAMLQQGMQVFGGIFKRVYRCMRQEMRLQYTLNGIYLNPEEYFDVVDGDAKVMQEDYWGSRNDIYPAADPNAFSQREKAAKNQFLAQRAGTVAGYDHVQVELRLLESMDIGDVNQVFPLDDQGQPTIPPPPNKELEIQVAEEQRKTEESRMKAEINAATAESQIMLDEAQVQAIRANIQSTGKQDSIQEFDSVTKRMKEIRESLQAKQESLAERKKDGTKQGASK